MWPFKSKDKNPKTQYAGPACTNCQSLNTQILPNRNNVRTWRGQRYSVCRCFDCGQDFYVEEQKKSLSDNNMPVNDLVDDEEELHAAEEEIKNHVKKDNCGLF